MATLVHAMLDEGMHASESISVGQARANVSITFYSFMDVATSSRVSFDIASFIVAVSCDEDEYLRYTMRDGCRKRHYIEDV